MALCHLLHRSNVCWVKCLVCDETIPGVAQRLTHQCIRRADIAGYDFTLVHRTGQGALRASFCSPLLCFFLLLVWFCCTVTRPVQNPLFCILCWMWMWLLCLLWNCLFCWHAVSKDKWNDKGCTFAYLRVTYKILWYRTLCTHALEVLECLNSKYEHWTQIWTHKKSSSRL